MQKRSEENNNTVSLEHGGLLELEGPLVYDVSMGGTTFRVNLHCHSTVSDGDLSPDVLAAYLAKNGVVYAALTDHDRVDGAETFRSAAGRQGIGVISGIEFTAVLKGREVHILGYGVDASRPGFKALLKAVRRGSDPGLRAFLSGLGARAGGVLSGAPPGSPHPASEIIQAIHQAGGLAVFAHPLTGAADFAEAAGLTEELAGLGLDGLEAFYGPYPAADQEALIGLADRLSLLVTGGSDLHGPERNGEAPPFVDLPAERWRALRDALLRAGSFEDAGAGGGQLAAAPAETAKSKRGRGRRTSHSLLRIAAPTAAAILLFVASVFGVVLPNFEQVLLDKKKEMIRELTTSIHSMLTQYEADVKRGRVTEEAARRSAIEHVRGLRYGSEGLDYFWVTDRGPVMIVHPYRPDLEGTDVGDFRDASGKRVFHLFLEAVETSTEGYVEYLWQWKDDASRIVPKLSFVKRFDPWGWVIGTGIYLGDVSEEIRRLEGHLRTVLALITAAVTVLLLFIAKQGLTAERSRRAAQASLEESYERYRTLSESRTEGLVMTVDGFCTFANETARTLLGYGETELVLLRVSDIVGPRSGEGLALEQFLETLARGGSYECALKRKDGSTGEALLAASPFEFGERRGSILSLRPVPVRRDGQISISAVPSDWPSLLPVGLLRAKWTRQAEVLWTNAAAPVLLGLDEGAEIPGRSLYAFFEPEGGTEDFQRRLEKGEIVAARCRSRTRADRFLKLFLIAVRDPAGGERHLDAALVDVTAETAEARMEAKLIEGLEALPLFLGSKVGELGTEAQSCPMDADAAEVSRLASGGRGDILVVVGPEGQALGLLEPGSADRVPAAGGETSGRNRRAFEIMEAPLLRLPEDATVSEALRLFGSSSRSALLAEGRPGGPRRVLRRGDLVPVCGDAAWALREEIRAARSLGELKLLRSRFAKAARLALDGGLAAPAVMRGLSELSDLVAEALVKRETERLGPPPGRFALLALGSEGRRELSPGSDQDNALVYEAAEDEGASSAYFSELGTALCANLETLGVPACPGGLMASRENWRGDFGLWKTRLKLWAAEPNPEEVLAVSIFLDFRTQAGDGELALALRAHLDSVLTGSPALLPFLARDVADRSLPNLPRTGVLLDLVREGGPALDLKALMAPIAGCARILAVASGVRATNTLGRLEALDSVGRLKTADRREMQEAYGFLLSLRLASRIRSAARNAAPDDGVGPAALTKSDEARLRHARDQAELSQRLLAHEFLGAAL